MFASEQKVYSRSISGVFSRWRWAMVFLTQIVFYGLPWLQWGERQMVLFDLGARRFYLFGLVLYPQDFIYLTGLLIISALGLFCLPPWPGVCGGLLLSADGLHRDLHVDRKQGRRRSQCPHAHRQERLDFGEDLEKVAQAVLWIVLSLWTGFTFVGYFVPIRELGVELMAFQGNWQIFWWRSTASPPTAMPAICASRSASTCVPMHAFRVPCSTRTP
jgi:polyferredoxin